MLPLEVQSTQEVSRGIADRVRRSRLERGWSQKEISERAGIALPTYRLFERTGRISLERLLKLAVVLDARGAFGHLFAMPAAGSLAELERRGAGEPARQRGKRSDAQA